MVDQDQLIFEEKDETFTCSIGITSDENISLLEPLIISQLKNIFSPQMLKKSYTFQKRKNDVRYSVDFQGYFYVHTNDEARDYKVLRCKTDQIDKLEVFIPQKKRLLLVDLNF